MSFSKLVWGIVIFVGAFLFVWCFVFGSSVYDIPVVGDLLPGSDNGHNSDGHSGGNNGNTISADASMAKKISSAIEPSNSYVRSLSLSLISSKHGGNYNIGQICDIYTGLNNRWTYVNDPRGSEYFASAGESARLLKGDCDDFAILMASCIEAIGGTARVIVAQSNSKGGHAYAEVYMTSSKSEKDSLAEDIVKIYRSAVYTHEDYSTGKFWLNLDWSANHPGGKFFPNSGSILIIHPNGYYERQNFSPNYTY